MADHEPTHAVSVDLRTVLQPKTNRTAWGRAQRILLEFAAVSFWSYGLIQVFVANTDDLFVSHLPTSFQWIVNFKFLLFLAVACVFWLLLGTGRFIFCFLNVVFYPFVLLFIRLPVFLYRQKSWALERRSIN